MTSLWEKIKNTFQNPEITPAVIAVQLIVSVHAGYLFIKGERHFFEGLLFVTYVVVSAAYWKRFASKKKK